MALRASGRLKVRVTIEPSRVTRVSSGTGLGSLTEAALREEKQRPGHVPVSPLSASSAILAPVRACSIAEVALTALTQPTAAGYGQSDRDLGREKEQTMTLPAATVLASERLPRNYARP